MAEIGKRGVLCLEARVVLVGVFATAIETFGDVAVAETPSVAQSAQYRRVPPCGGFTLAV
jgi:hypothetical protein